MPLSLSQLETTFNEFLYKHTQAQRNELDPSHPSYNPIKHARDRNAREHHGDVHADMESQIAAAAAALLEVIAANNKAD